jgi:hypothetical protein
MGISECWTTRDTRLSLTFLADEGNLVVKFEMNTVMNTTLGVEAMGVRLQMSVKRRKKNTAREGDGIDQWLASVRRAWKYSRSMIRCV